MMRIAKVALVTLGIVGAIASPIQAAAQEPIDWEGYAACYASCSAAFPGREADCQLSCARQYGVDTGEGDTRYPYPTEVECRWGRCSVE